MLRFANRSLQTKTSNICRYLYWVSVSACKVALLCAHHRVRMHLHLTYRILHTRTGTPVWWGYRSCIQTHAWTAEVVPRALSCLSAVRLRNDFCLFTLQRNSSHEPVRVHWFASTLQGGAIQFVAVLPAATGYLGADSLVHHRQL